MSLTFDQLTAYRRFWLKHPPTDLLVASYLGYKGEDVGAPTTPEAAQSKIERTVERLAEMMGVRVPDGK